MALGRRRLHRGVVAGLSDLQHPSADLHQEPLGDHHLDGREASKGCCLLRLPRIEMLVDLTTFREGWEGSYRRLLAALTEQDSFVPDDDHPDAAAVQLIIPQVCREAHRAAVFADRIYIAT